jgi:hypothetical protein
MQFAIGSANGHFMKTLITFWCQATITALGPRLVYNQFAVFLHNHHHFLFFPLLLLPPFPFLTVFSLSHFSLFRPFSSPFVPFRPFSFLYLFTPYPSPHYYHSPYEHSINTISFFFISLSLLSFPFPTSHFTLLPFPPPNAVTAFTIISVLKSFP